MKMRTPLLLLLALLFVVPGVAHAADVPDDSPDRLVSTWVNFWQDLVRLVMGGSEGDDPQPPGTTSGGGGTTQGQGDGGSCIDPNGTPICVPHG